MAVSNVAGHTAVQVIEDDLARRRRTMIEGPCGIVGKHEHDRGTLRGEAEHFVFGDILRLLVVPVEVRDFGDVVFIRRSPPLGLPQGRAVATVDVNTMRSTASVGGARTTFLTASDVHLVER